MGIVAKIYMQKNVQEILRNDMSKRCPPIVFICLVSAQGLILLILLPVFFRRGSQASLPFRHQIGRSSCKLGRCELAQCWPRNTIGDVGINDRILVCRIPLPKAMLSLARLPRPVFDCNCTYLALVLGLLS